MKSLVRRTFLKSISRAGIISLTGTLILPEYSKGISKEETLPGKKSNPVCLVNKEIRIAGPQLSLAPITGMTYIGLGLRREETLSFMQSSDWHIMSLSRTSDDNGQT